MNPFRHSRLFGRNLELLTRLGTSTANPLYLNIPFGGFADGREELQTTSDLSVP